MKRAGEVLSGRTNQDRKASPPPLEDGRGWDLIEKKQALLPVNGFSAAMQKRSLRPKGRRGGKRAPTRVPKLPPRLELVTTVDCIRRVSIASSASSVAVTRGSLLSIIGGIVTVANTTVTLFATSVRLRRITCWPAAASSVLIQTPSTAAGAEQALQKESLKNADLPTGITVDEPVTWHPARGTYLDMWQTHDNSTDQLLAISGAAGAVMDIHLQFTLAGAVSAAPTTVTTSTVSLGTVVTQPLDTSNKIVVVGYQQANH